jgi:hypothetical protein
MLPALALLGCGYVVGHLPSHLSAVPTAG